MKTKDIRSGLFDAPWPAGRNCFLVMASGERVHVVHRDFALFPPDETFAIIATPGNGYRVLDTGQIASLEFSSAKPLKAR